MVKMSLLNDMASWIRDRLDNTMGLKCEVTGTSNYGQVQNIRCTDHRNKVLWGITLKER